MNGPGADAGWPGGGLTLTLHPIGRIENGLPLGTPKETLMEAVSRIVLDPELALGLTGLEKEPTILVLFQFHLAADFELLQHPRGDVSRPRRGVFALRSPRRPNPLGATEVDLLEIRGNLLLVRGLDAVDGTPVLDLKPAWRGPTGEAPAGAPQGGRS
jgi:tRNA-Thr(GGU) m(6)t(6)A37 methyltransferase TsaA